MAKKKVLFISSWYPNKAEPTDGNFVQRHAEAVSLLNDVEVLHAVGIDGQEQKYVFDDQQINGIRTLIVYYRNSTIRPLNFSRRMKAYSMGFRKMQKPDVVHANVLHNSMLFAVYLKKTKNIPFVVTEHWTALQKHTLGSTPRKIKLIAKFIGNQASYVLPVSHNLEEGLRYLGVRTPSKVISNVVDTSVFTVKESVEKKPTTFLHISNLIPRKRPEVIIETVHKLKRAGYNLQLRIGGDGDTSKIRELVKKLDAEAYISVFNALSYRQVAEEMQESDFFILFSENETQGCVILESFACGKPVIATAVGGVPEFVQEGFGILVEKDNKKQLFEEMSNVLNDQIRFKKADELRRYVVDFFSRESIGAAFTDVYQQILRS